MTKEEQALAIASDRERLRQRLNEGKVVLCDRMRTGFGRGRFDFANRQLIGNNGVVLEWRVRYRPDQPESYHNQQTNQGSVVIARGLCA